ncbi:MAG: toprim domain-containing protein [Erysipelotrichaceae bacterium]
MANDYKEKLMKKRAINKERIKEQVSLLDIAAEYFTVEKHGVLYRLKEHDSCIIYPETNTWHRYAYNKSGDVLSFFEEFSECGNLTFNQAYKKLLPLIDEAIDVDPKVTKKREAQKSDLQYKQYCAIQLKKQLQIDDENRHVMAYLIKERKIDPFIVYEMLDKHYIYQINNSLGGKNVAFCGYNEYGMLSTVCVRACNSSSTFKGDLKNCDYNYGWFYASNIKPDDFCPEIKGDKPLICFESYIDMMSYMTILKKNHQEISDYNYISCGSIEKKDVVLKYQEKYKIKDIIIAFDNDEPGQEATIKLKKILEVKGCNVKQDVSIEKDWNDQLKFMSKSLTERITTAKNNHKQQEQIENEPHKMKSVDKEI